MKIDDLKIGELLNISHAEGMYKVTCVEDNYFLAVQFPKSFGVDMFNYTDNFYRIGHIMDFILNDLSKI